MLTGRLPYGTKVAQARTKALQRKLKYAAAHRYNDDIPPWIDRTLQRAVHPDPQKRYEAMSELVYDLRHPKDEYLRSGQVPILERNPLLFWQSVCFVLAVSLAYLLITR